jgi:hypothetical protein
MESVRSRHERSAAERDVWAVPVLHKISPGAAENATGGIKDGFAGIPAPRS